MGSPPPATSVILRVDENDPVASTPCQSLRISYKDPKFDDLLTEEVFLDPRDSLLGENGLLLVNAAGVTALQQKSDREHRWAVSAQASVDSCRRDYLREQQYLLNELRRLSQLAQSVPKGVDKDIAELMDGAMKSADLAASDPHAVASADDLSFLSESHGGPRLSEDDELMDHLGKMSLHKEDDLTVRILLQRIRADTAALVEERSTLREAVEAVEGNSAGEDKEEGLKVLIEEMFKQAEKEEADRADIIDALFQKATSPEQHKAIEDSAIKNLRTKFETMFNRRQELEPKVEHWREQLAVQEERAARHFVLTEEVSKLEAARDENAEEAERRKKEREEEARKEAEAARLAAVPKEVPVEDLTGQIIDKLDQETQAKIKEQQWQVTISQRRMVKLNEEAQSLESGIEEFEQRKSAIGARITAAENEQEASKDTISSSEEMATQAEDTIRRVSIQEQAVKKRKEELEDELSAAKRPPPKVTDTRKLEGEVEAAKLKNQELRETEAALHEKERTYEARFDNAENAWKAYEEEEAAMALQAELVASERKTLHEAMLREAAEAAAAAGKTGDPLLLDYKDRLYLPQYSAVTRTNLLHMDNRARDRRLSRTRRGVNEDYTEQLVARMRASESEVAASSGPKSKVPVNFRRPEDIKVRLKGAERNVGNMAGDLAERGAGGAKLAEDLHHLGRRLGSSAAESLGLHAEIPRTVSDILGEGGLPACAIREQLVHALQEHQVCASRAEDAWRQAEAGCTRGAPELELELEQEACARCEDDLISAARELYNASRQAACEGPPEIAPRAESSCRDWDAAEPRLTEAANARGTAWPEILGLAAALADEREMQVDISRHLKAEERRRNLLDAERAAPPAARRALAAMRLATSTTARLSSVLLE